MCFCVSVNFYVQYGGYIYFPRSEFSGSSVYIKENKRNRLLWKEPQSGIQSLETSITMFIQQDLSFATFSKNVKTNIARNFLKLETRTSQ